MSVESVNNSDAAKIAQLMAQAQEMSDVDVAAETAEIAPILRGTNVSVTTPAGGVGQGQAAREVDSLPALDSPDAKKVGPADLEELIAYLTIDNEKVQAEQAQQRIEQLLGEMNKTHEEALASIKDALEQSEKLAEEQRKSKILGWIMTAISAIAAIALSVVTMGAATGPAIAGLVLTCASVALNVTMQVLQETDVINDFLEKEANKKVEEAQAEGKNLSYEEAFAEVSGTFNAIMTAVQCVLSLAAIGCSLGSIAQSGAKAAGKAAEKAVEEAGKKAAKAASETVKKGVVESLKKFAQNAKVQLAMKITQIITSSLSLVGSAASTKMSFDQAEMSKDLADKQAALKEVEKLLEQIQQACEEEEDSLQDIIAMLQDNMSLLAELIGQSCDATNQIAMNIQQSGV